MADDDLQYIRLPDGTIGSYPKGVPDSEIADAIDRQFPPARPAGTTIRAEPGFREKFGRAVEDVTGLRGGEPSAQRPGAAASPLEQITRGIESYTPEGRAEHPILSRIGDVTKGFKEYNRLIAPLTPLLPELSWVRGAAEAEQVAPPAEPAQLPRVVRPPGRIGPGMRTREARLPEPPGALPEGGGPPPAPPETLVPAPPAAVTPTPTSQLDAIARRMFGRPYDALPQELKVQVVREVGPGAPGGVERRVTLGQGPVAERRAGAMPAPSAAPEGAAAPTPPGTLPIARPAQPAAEPTPSETLPRTTLPPAPPPQTLGGGEVPRASLDEILRKATGQPAPPRPGIPLNEQLRAGEPSVPAEDPFKREFPDTKIRQFARVNGAELVRAAGDRPEVLIQVNNLTNPEIREVGINSGIDLGTKHVGSRQGLGPEQISRQDLIDQLIRQGVKPEDFPKLSKPVREPGALQKIIEQLKGEEGFLDISFGRNKPGPLKKMVSADEGTQHTAEKLVRPEDGLPANPEPLVLEKDGKTYYFGPLNKDQFKGKWEQQLTPAEIEEIRLWYEKVGRLFKENFGDTPQTPRRLLGWLVSQRNTPPARGMQNVFRAEDVLAGFPKVHGMLGEDVINAMLQGEQSEGGLGPKLHDFVDSAYGRNTRTWMGDRPQGGKPAVIDVHSGRGTGYYDDTLITFIRKNWGDEIADGIVRDLGHGKSGAPNALQYERGSERYNKLADELNQDNYHNGGWEPLQVQAVDWVANGLQTGRPMEQPEDIFTKNTQRIAYELIPSPDAPYGKMFAWDKLSPQQGAAITRDVSEATMKSVLKEAGGYRVHQVYGPGGYLTKLNPSAVTSHMGSPEAVDRAMDLLGHLFQQDQVIASRGLKTGNGYALEYREAGTNKLANPGVVQKFWNTVRENFPQAEGFNPVRDRGGAGIQILKYEGKWSDEEIAQGEQALIKAADEAGINGVVDHEAADVRQSNNDWKANPKGEERLNRLKTTGRPGVVRRIQAEYEPRVLAAIRSAFRKYAPDLLPRK